MSGSIWRKTDSGWEQIKTLWRKTDSGWEAIKSVWRHIEGAWERVFSEEDTTGPTPTVSPTFLNQSSSSDIFAGDSLTLTRGTWTNVNAGTSYRLTIYRTTTPNAAVNDVNWEPIVRETQAAGKSISFAETVTIFPLATQQIRYQTGTAHGYSVGDVVTITGMTNSAFNRTNATIQSVSSTTQFSVNNTSGASGSLINQNGLVVIPVTSITMPAGSNLDDQDAYDEYYYMGEIRVRKNNIDYFERIPSSGGYLSRMSFTLSNTTFTDITDKGATISWSINGLTSNQISNGFLERQYIELRAGSSTGTLLKTYNSTSNPQGPGPTATSYTLDDDAVLDPNTTYHVRVIGVGYDGWYSSPNPTTDFTGATFTTTGQVPEADVNPTLTRVNYPGNGTNTITVGYTLRGNTGQWTPNPTDVYWGFQYGTSTDVTNGTSAGIIDNGIDTSENQNHDLSVSSVIEDYLGAQVSLVGKYIRFYTIAEDNGAQADTFNTGWIGPIYAAPGQPGVPNISFASAYSETEVNVTATWTDASSYYEYTVQYYNPSSLQWVDLFSKTTSGAFSSSFRAPVGTFSYRVRNDNGDGIYAYSNTVSVTLTGPYQFTFGDNLYPNTNGWIGLDSGHSGTTIPTSGRGFAVFPGDFVYDYMYEWSGGSGTSASDNVKYVLSYNGYRYNAALTDANRITWQAIFYTNQQYADFKIIYKGSNISGGITVGFYNNGTVTSGLPGPYSIGTGTTWRVYYNNTGTNSFGISFSEILNTAPNNVMLNLSTPTNGSMDDGHWVITTAASRYNTPSVSFGTSANTSTALSIPFTEANGCASIDYVVRTTSHTGSVISGPTNDTDTPLSVTGLTANTNYYITATPKNYLGQTGNNVQFTTITAPGQPTVTFSSVTTSSFNVTWGATGATSYDVDIYTTSGLVSLSGYPKLNTTTTSASPFGLSSGTQYTVSVFPKNSGGTGTGRIVTQRTLYDARTPTFGTLTRGDGKISSSVTNYDTNWTFSGSASVGTFTWGTASGATRPFEVTGLSDNQSTTVTVTTTRTDYANGSGTQTGSSLASALTPSFGTNTSVTGGFNGSVTNYDTNYTWGISTNSGSVSWGTASGSTRPFSVTGLSAGGSATVTVTTSRTGYKNGSNTTTGTASSNVAPSGGAAGVLQVTSGTDGRIGVTYQANTDQEATGTPSPTKTYQWQYYRSSSAAWTNITGETGSTYTVAYTATSSAEGTISMPGRDIRCNITWTNSQGSQSSATNSKNIALPTITGITVDFSDTTPYVVYRCYGYNFRSIASVVKYGTLSTPESSTDTIYSQAANSTIPITRNSNLGGLLYYYQLVVTPYSTTGTGAFPSNPYSSGVTRTTSILRNNATNRGAGWINTYGTGDA